MNIYPAEKYPYVIRVVKKDGEVRDYSYAKNETIAMQNLAQAEAWVAKGAYTAAYMLCVDPKLPPITPDHDKDGNTWYEVVS